jgi:hypothetical protein
MPSLERDLWQPLPWDCLPSWQSAGDWLPGPSDSPNLCVFQLRFPDSEDTDRRKLGSPTCSERGRISGGLPRLAQRPTLSRDERRNSSPGIGGQIERQEGRDSEREGRSVGSKAVVSLLVRSAVVLSVPALVWSESMAHLFGGTSTIISNRSRATAVRVSKAISARSVG